MRLAATTKLCLTGLVLGGLLVLGVGGGTAATAARAPKGATFYNGTLSGGDIQSWNLWVATVGTKAYAVTFGSGGPAPTGAILGAKGEGSFKKKKLKMDLKAIAGDSPHTQIGTIAGATDRKGVQLTGTFSMAGRTGNIQGTRVDKNTAASTAIVGTFTSHDRHKPSQFVRITLAADGTFSLFGHALDLDIGEAIGLWQVGSDGNLWLLPLDITEENDFFDITLKLNVPLKLKFGRTGNNLSLFSPIHDDEILITFVKGN